jgi:hypothetical protein
MKEAHKIMGQMGHKNMDKSFCPKMVSKFESANLHTRTKEKMMKMMQGSTTSTRCKSPPERKQAAAITH